MQRILYVSHVLILCAR